MVAPETGFRTWGGIIMLAEIPPGWHTGSHSHGEEAIYIIKGKGFSIIDDKQYEWDEGSCIHIPFGSVHQHFNDGTETVQYLSAMSPHLEFFCGISKFEQYEDCGETSGVISKPLGETAASKPDEPSSSRRLVLRRSEMLVVHGGEESGGSVTRKRFLESMPEETRKGMFSGDKNKGMRTMSIRMMGSRPDFYGEEVEITDVLHHPPGEIGGKHAHMEAMLYVLSGEGYLLVDDQQVPFFPGTCMHVQGPQTVHQAVNTSNVECRLIRIHFGIRYNFYQGIAKRKFPYLFLQSLKPPPASSSAAAGERAKN